MRDRVKNAYKIVIKVGSSILTEEDGSISKERILRIVEDIVFLLRDGRKVTLVSSGAVAAGKGRLKDVVGEEHIPSKQALSAVGQGLLMSIYNNIFSIYNTPVAQILLAPEDISHRKKYLNAKNTFRYLFMWGVVPIVNENDTVAVSEIKFGDNDTLSALVASLIDADLLILLSDVEGLYDKNPLKYPDARFISQVDEITKEIEELAGEKGTERAVGGMKTKIKAAKIATMSGIDLIIANGFKSGIIKKIVSGENVGTLFVSKKEGLHSRKKWIVSSTVKGKLMVDEGAVDALLKNNKSLLPSGIIKVTGKFDSGDIVEIIDKDNRIIGKGITYYTSEEIEKIKGMHTSKIKDILGYKYYNEVIDRDNLVIL